MSRRNALYLFEEIAPEDIKRTGHEEEYGFSGKDISYLVSQNMSVPRAKRQLNQI